VVKALKLTLKRDISPVFGEPREKKKREICRLRELNKRKDKRNAWDLDVFKSDEEVGGTERMQVGGR